MKLRYIALLWVMALSAAAMPAMADMTDDQVVEYVKQATAAGKSQQQIGRELIAKGVTQAQVERLKARFNQGKDSEAAPQAGLATASRNRSTVAEAAPQAGLAEDGISDVTSTVSTVEVGADASRPNIFGHDVFTGKSLTFEPNTNMATPQNYRLGPGDEVIIDIWGANEDQIRQTISPEGSIIVSQLGPIYLNGMTIAEANTKLRNVFAPKYAGVGGDNPDSDINLTLGQVRSIQVDVMGEVTTPGTFRLSPFSSVFHALYQAGGISDIGTMRNIQIIRNGRRIAEVDVYDYLFNGKDASSLRLQEGDVIIVPPYEQLVQVDGNVKRPMYYELRRGETLDRLLEYAGGFAGGAFADQVLVSRQGGKENELYNVASGEYATYRLADGDIVTVGETLDRFANRVEVRGAVYRPGNYAIDSDLNSVRSLIRHAEGTTENAFLGRAQLFREGPDLTPQVIALDLEAIVNGTAPDVPLKRNDVLVVPGVHELSDLGILTIGGQVANPGEYSFAEGTTIEDLIVRAGGLREGASTVKVDVSRRITDTKGLESTSRLSQNFTFGLKDGLVVDGEPGFVLHPYDIVQVRRAPSYQKQRNVQVDGEIAFDGTYTLENKNERLSNLISRAGGVTDAAYLRGAYLLRQLTPEERIKRDEVIRLVSRTQTANDSIALDKLDLGNSYSVGIELDKALAMPGSDYDIVLREGDRLVIPERLTTVSIQGDVLYPNTVTYRQGKKLSYYIDQAGGYGDRARKNKAFIVYANGTVARAKGSSLIEPGCTIIVPSKPDKPGMTLPQILAMATSFASLGTMAASIASLIK